jgi:hypothetical protein
MAKIKVICVKAFKDEWCPTRPVIRPMVNAEYTVKCEEDGLYILEEISMKQGTTSQIQSWSKRNFKMVGELIKPVISPETQKRNEEVKKKNEMWAIGILLTFA